MGLLDYLVIGLYFLSVLYLGFRYRHQKITKDYFLGGRQIGGMLVGISVTVTLCSAISLMGTIAFVFQWNLKLLPGIFVIPLTIPIITLLIIPFYRKLPITTGYEYLEIQPGGGEMIVEKAVSMLQKLHRFSQSAQSP